MLLFVVPYIMAEKAILVTGAHRSGSTWVGRMLALAPGTTYIHEPFNPRHRPGVCNATFPTWFTYVCEENEESYRHALQRTLAFRYDLRAELSSLRSLKDLGRMTRDAISFGTSRIRMNRPVVKDPIACFSTKWLERTFNMDVVIVVRHPAAFVGSLKVVRESHPFAHFLDQPQLMKDHLGRFRAELEVFSDSNNDFVGEGILLWRMIYGTVLQWREQHPGWIVVRHEDLSSEPDRRFDELYRELGLEFTPKARRAIVRSTRGKAGPSRLRRESLSNIWSWKDRLSAEEISRIQEGTSDISPSLYANADWHR